MRRPSLLISAAAIVMFPMTAMAALGGLDETATKAGIKDSGTDITLTLATLTNLVLSFIGVLFLIILIWGGTVWMTAAGNQENIKKAKAIVSAAVIGLLIVLSAYAITQFVGGAFGA